MLASLTRKIGFTKPIMALGLARLGSKLNLDNINPRLLKAQYAMRGRLVLRAEELQKQLKAGKTLPFKSIISCNLGNPHAVGQKALTYPSQVLSLLVNSQLLNPENLEVIKKIYPSDVIERAQRYLKGIPGGIGAYTGTKGLQMIRDEVAQFLEKRDGFEANTDNIFLTAGASQGVAFWLNTILRSPYDTLLVPRPQYPLYAATITLNGASYTSYDLDEPTGWSVQLRDIQRAYNQAESEGKRVRGLTLINPGNPTGQVLDRKNMEELVMFCHEHSIVLMADEVYQANYYNPDRPFISFKKVIGEMGPKYKNGVELVSFHSCSKGFLGECGKRGGFFEAVNIDEAVMNQVYKMGSINLCSNVIGQVLVGLMVNPPKPGEPSYEVYKKEQTAQLKSLASKAKKLVDAFNKLDGFSCQQAAGAMYAYPSINIPPKAVAAAKEAHMAPDEFYCANLLEQTGVVVVPGAGVGQKDGTYHFRTTFLPSETEIDDMVSRIKVFHKDFVQRFK